MAAVLSETGSAHDLIQLSRNGQVDLVVSSLVLDEVERNLNRKAPNHFTRFRRHLDGIPFERIEPVDEAVAREAEHVAAKDAAIVAAAVAAEVNFLVTYDEKHLLGQAEDIGARHEIVVCPPAVVLSSLRRVD